MIDNGLVIKIEKNASLIQQEEYVNGMRSRCYSLSTNDVLRMLLSTIEPVELVHYLITEIDNFEEILREVYPVLDTGLIAGDYFSFLYENFSLEGCEDIISELYFTLCKEIDTRTFNPDQLSIQLKGTLNKVNQINYADASKFNSLFRAIVDKIDLNKKGASLLISYFIKKIYESNIMTKKNEEELKVIFDEIVDYCKGSWVREAIAKRRPQATVTETPILPSGTIYFKETIDGHHVVVIEVPKQRRDILFRKQIYKNVGHPKMLFMFAVKDQMIKDMRIFTIANKPVTNDTKIYRYPFSHVYSNFKVCWSDQKQRVKYLSQLPMVIEMWFKSPNSHHLAGGSDLESLIQSLQNNDFDDDILVESGHTFGDIIAK